MDREQETAQQTEDTKSTGTKREGVIRPSRSVSVRRNGNISEGWPTSAA